MEYNFPLTFYSHPIYSLLQTINLLTERVMQLTDVTRLAGSLTPAMYHYVRIFIRHLLPPKDRELESVLIELRTMSRKPDEPRKKFFQKKGHDRHFGELCKRLMLILEEVMTSDSIPGRPNPLLHPEVRLQRKLLCGMQLAYAGFPQLAQLRFNEIQPSLDSIENTGIKLQIKWHLMRCGDRSLEPTQTVVRDLEKYQAEMMATVSLKHVIEECLYQGLIPEGKSWKTQGNSSEIELIQEILNILGNIQNGSLPELCIQIDQCCNRALEYVRYENHLSGLIAFRMASWLGFRPDARRESAHFMLKAANELPIHHAKGWEARIYATHLCLAIGKIEPLENLFPQLQSCPENERFYSKIPILISANHFLNKDFRTASRILSTCKKQEMALFPYRIQELQVAFEREDLHLIPYRIEAFRKLLQRRPDPTRRCYTLLKTFARLESRSLDYHRVEEEMLPGFEEMNSQNRWNPFDWEPIPMESWIHAHSNQLSLVDCLQKWAIPKE